LGRFCSGPIFGKHIHDLFERAHLANLLELIAKIFKREFFLAQLAFEVGGGFLINRLLDAFDERHEVAHAENAGDDTLGDKILLGHRTFRPGPRTLPVRRSLCRC